MKIRLISSAALMLVIGLAAPAAADDGADFENPFEELALILRTRDDPNVLPDMDVCAEAPFPVNVAIGGTVWAPKIKMRNAVVKRPFARYQGTATACMLFTDLTFPPFSTVPVYATFELREGTFTGTGECLITSNDVPVPGIILMGCSALVIHGPDGVVGGIASTTTVVNPLGIPGYETGSYMIIRSYRTAD